MIIFWMVNKPILYAYIDLKAKKWRCFLQVHTSWTMVNWGKYSMGQAENATHWHIFSCSSCLWLFGWLKTRRSHWNSVEKKQRISLWYISIILASFLNFSTISALNDSVILFVNWEEYNICVKLVNIYIHTHILLSSWNNWSRIYYYRLVVWCRWSLGIMSRARESLPLSL